MSVATANRFLVCALLAVLTIPAAVRAASVSRDINTYVLFALDDLSFKGRNADVTRGFILGGNVGVNRVEPNTNGFLLTLGGASADVVMSQRHAGCRRLHGPQHQIHFHRRRRRPLLQPHRPTPHAGRPLFLPQHLHRPRYSRHRFFSSIRPAIPAQLTSPSMTETRRRPSLRAHIATSGSRTTASSTSAPASTSCEISRVAKTLPST